MHATILAGEDELAVCDVLEHTGGGLELIEVVVHEGAVTLALTQHALVNGGYITRHDAYLFLCVLSFDVSPLLLHELADSHVLGTLTLIQLNATKVKMTFPHILLVLGLPAPDA